VNTLVVLPTVDEAATITEVVRGVKAAGADALVVDDASRDRTGELAEAAGATVLGRDRRMGLGSAYRAGFAWGLERGYDVLVEMDSDLSHDPAALPTLIAAVEEGADLAIGSRYVPGGSIPEWAPHRRALSRWGNRYAAAVLGMPVADATSGYRAYRADALREIEFSTVRANGYGFQIEMAYRIARNGRKVVEVPISFTERTEGKSKMSSRIVVEALALVTAWGARDRVLRARRR
jgi:dolichol-phosphate mannosyltransferase